MNSLPEKGGASAYAYLMDCTLKFVRMDNVKTAMERIRVVKIDSAPVICIHGPQPTGEDWGQ